MTENTTVTLNNPVKRGDSEISEVTLREPSAGDLRGLNLIEVIQMNSKSVVALLPRITSPILDEQEIWSLKASDFSKLSVALVSFFADPEAPPA